MSGVDVLISDFSTRKPTYEHIFLEKKLGLNEIFSQIKEEFEDHLTSINENTNEIQSNSQYLAELDSKIEKLNEKLDRIQFFLEKNLSYKQEKTPNFNILPLTKKEQEVFLVLYTLEEAKGAVSYVDIARRVALPEELVSSYITTMIEKGVPIIKKYINNKAYLKLDRSFKNIQAKENILKLNQKTLV